MSSRVVLIGCSRYDELPDLPTVRNNIGGLAAIFRDPGVWGIPRENCRVVPNPTTACDLIDPITVAAEQAADTLLVYYAGHGLVDRTGELHLTLRDSVPGRSHTQVPFQWVRDPISDSGARRRIIILDCCYSGLVANGTTLGTIDHYAEQAAVEGSFVLTATSANRLALAPADRRYTAFTGEFIEVLGEGLGGAAELISLTEVYRNVRARLVSQSMPLPQTRDQNDIGSRTLFRNKAFRPENAHRPISAERRDAESLAALRYVRTAVLRASAGFLRREELPTHDRLYVPRLVDRHIATAIQALSPGNLRRTQRTDKANPSQLVDRQSPPQFIVFSDGPGSGKTMLAVQLSRGAGGALLRQAEGPVAAHLRSVLGDFGTDFGLAALTAARVPIVYVLDGLDRADHRTEQKNIIDLFRFIDRELNPLARANGLLAFPLTVMFTVRDDRWDRWFTVFEGRRLVQLRCRASRFTSEEFGHALQRYESVYDYHLAGRLPAYVAASLAVPINLRILSESHQYGGHVDLRTLPGEPMLATYLRRKGELAAQFLGSSAALDLVGALAPLATVMVERKAAMPPREVLSVLTQTLALTPDEADTVLDLLIGERILWRDARGIGFVHPGLEEYLIAAEAVRRMTESGRADLLERLTALAAESRAVSTTAVRASVKEVASGNSDAERMVDEHYRTSAVYAGSRMAALRSDIAAGGVTSADDLESIYGSLESLSAEDVWNAFFVVAARNNRQSAQQIMRVFTVAWDANDGRADRWKLLSKLHRCGLLYRDDVIRRVLHSPVPREWETLLGWAVHEPERSGILDRIVAVAGGSPTELLPSGAEWDQVRGLLTVLGSGTVYVDGQLFREPTATFA
ncbi:caspase, EACC1-associated type [Nocardia transvalensis]|uniref:caspase, EACC1-associated type n=1 Tax=Nocardia transvalensis TaxID=37333 RepID=UPI001894D214|nr:caspase family protein [Nocardia transvalensis]MBF6332038.1 caspase family protein [Nocardia transvalensis]